MCIHCLSHFSPRPTPPPSHLHYPPSASPLAYSMSLCCTFLQFLWRVDISNNKKDLAFLLVEIKGLYREIPSIAFMYKCVTTHVHSSLTDLFTGSWSPSDVDLCRFKVSVLVPLELGHQILSCLGFRLSLFSCMCSPFLKSPKSNNIAVFALDLKTAYEGEHIMFGLMSLANLPQNDVLQFHPILWEYRLTK
jgi:hypothetical protein